MQLQVHKVEVESWVILDMMMINRRNIDSMTTQSGSNNSNCKLYDLPVVELWHNREVELATYINRRTTDMK